MLTELKKGKTYYAVIPAMDINRADEAVRTLQSLFGIKIHSYISHNLATSIQFICLEDERSQEDYDAGPCYKCHTWPCGCKGGPTMERPRIGRAKKARMR